MIQVNPWSLFFFWATNILFYVIPDSHSIKDDAYGKVHADLNQLQVIHFDSGIDIIINNKCVYGNCKLNHENKPIVFTYAKNKNVFWS